LQWRHLLHRHKDIETLNYHQSKLINCCKKGIRNEPNCKDKKEEEVTPSDLPTVDRPLFPAEKYFGALQL